MKNTSFDFMGNWFLLLVPLSPSLALSLPSSLPPSLSQQYLCTLRVERVSL